MRKTQALLGIALLIGAAGCPPDGGRFNLIRPSGGGGGGPGPTSTEVPTKDALVSYLNALSSNNPGIQSDDISLTCYMNSAVGIPVSGKIRAQGSRNFRMTADAIGRREVDLGSNDQEFWYWIRQSGDPQVFCSYKALEDGKVKNTPPFPFQPDWVLEAMSMGKYGPAEKYELSVEKDQLKLIERTKSPQGVAVKKIIVFNRAKASTNPPSGCQPQITDFLLVDDATNKLVCSAHIARRQIIGKTEIPRELELRWPEAKLKLVLHLDHITLNNQIPPQVFVRARMNGVDSFDMATGRLEGVQQAGGPKGPPH